MKGLILLLFSLFCFQNLKCQDWCHQGSVWTYNFYTFGSSGYFRYSYQKDTIIHSIPCNKITVSAITATGFPLPVIDTNYNEPLYTFSRNDTVFFFNSYTNIFRPTYFLGANIGDTVNYFNPRQSHCPDDSIYHYLIEEKGTINISSINLRYYRARSVNHANTLFYPDTIRIIERIGCTEAIQPYHICVTDDDEFSLRCYHDDSFSVYQTNLSTPCDYLLSLPSNITSYKPKIYPNPTSSFLFVEHDLKTHCTVYNNLGSIVCSFITEKSIPANISFLPVGLYYVKIEDSQQTTYSSFLKQ